MSTAGRFPLAEGPWPAQHPPRRDPRRTWRRWHPLFMVRWQDSAMRRSSSGPDAHVEATNAPGEPIGLTGSTERCPTAAPPPGEGRCVGATAAAGSRRLARRTPLGTDRRRKRSMVEVTCRIRSRARRAIARGGLDDDAHSLGLQSACEPYSAMRLVS
jgi:hypothetical protein